MRHLQITLMHLRDRLIIHLQNVFCKASTTNLAKVFSRFLMNLSFRFVFETSLGHLLDVLARFLACLGKTSLRHLTYLGKTSLRHTVYVFLPTGMCFPNNGCHGNRTKGNFSVIIATVTTR